MDRIIAELGHVEILVNAAGINSGTPFFEISEEEWHRIIDVDLKSVFLACQVFGAHMVLPGNGGSVINISSASSGPPLSQSVHILGGQGRRESDHAVPRPRMGDSRCASQRHLPGFFPAEQNRKLLTEERVANIMRHTPMARYGEASELVGATVYLSSSKASGFRHRLHPAGGRRLPGNDDLVSAVVADTI